MSGIERTTTTMAPRSTRARSATNTYPTTITSHPPHLEVAGNIGQRLDHQSGDRGQEQRSEQSTDHRYIPLSAGWARSATTSRHRSTAAVTAAWTAEDSRMPS